MSKPVIKTDMFSRMAECSGENLVNHYKGLPVHALPGLHEYVGHLAKKAFPLPSRLIDLAAGGGALSLRLKDLGHEIMACDYVAENYRLSGTIPFMPLDLNSDYAARIQAKYDGAIAVEIIEHLENPRHFIREIFTLLMPGGTLILTTPNIDNPVSLACFMRFGWFQFFRDRDYENGHISPISQWSLRKIMSEVGFDHVRFSSFGDPFQMTRGWWRLKVLARLINRISVRKNNANGTILVVTAIKPKVDVQSGESRS